MKKPFKLYIDTSVWNFALETDRADCLLTWDFFRLLRNKREGYTVFIYRSRNLKKQDKKFKLGNTINNFSA